MPKRQWYMEVQEAWLSTKNGSGKKLIFIKYLLEIEKIMKKIKKKKK